MVGGQWCRFTFIDFLLGDIIVDGVSHNDGLFEALLYSTLALALCDNNINNKSIQMELPTP
jgi:hypothetical protein